MLSQQQSHSTPLSIDAPIRHFTSIDSTNLEARRVIDGGGQGPLWIVADEQTSGRGRLGRQWQSVPGNLYSTFLYQPECGPLAVSQLGFVTALAVAEAIDTLVTRPVVKLKWPNDCLIGGSKVAGILCEVLECGHVAIGCGINVASAPKGLAYPATSVSDAAGTPLAVQDVFAAYAQALQSMRAVWQHGENFAAITEQWAKRALGIGEIVCIKQEPNEISGQLLGIAPDGALLLLRADGASIRVLAGDLHIPSLAAMRKTQ
jgi:BirA family transcriptional regulator, biotin operon repressor / biotin---[acetyl-CoA-carboxylase] ligase